MSGISGLFDIARLAISANRAALQVTGHNISNVNTPGYTRQRAVLATSRPVSGNPGQIGTGVNAAEISRIYDKYLEFQVTTQKEYRGKSEILSSLLGRMEETFNESSGAGLNKAVSDFSAQPPTWPPIRPARRRGQPSSAAGRRSPTSSTGCMKT